MAERAGTNQSLAEETEWRPTDAAAASATAQDSIAALLEQTAVIERLSVDITWVLSGIQGLAGQTRLLALNAAIEAARAGAAGAGRSPTSS